MLVCLDYSNKRNAMTSVLIENMSDRTHGALERRASEHGRSIEAEIRAILDAALVDAPVGVGSALAALGRRHGGVDMDLVRDPAPGRAADFD